MTPDYYSHELDRAQRELELARSRGDYRDLIHIDVAIGAPGRQVVVRQLVCPGTPMRPVLEHLLRELLEGHNAGCERVEARENLSRARQRLQELEAKVERAKEELS